MGDDDGPQRGLREGAKGRLRCRGAVVTHGDGYGLGPRQLGSSCLASARLLNSVRWDAMGWDAVGWHGMKKQALAFVSVGVWCAFLVYFVFLDERVVAVQQDGGVPYLPCLLPHAHHGLA